MAVVNDLGVEVPPRVRSWRDKLTADYEIQQARLRLVIADDDAEGEVL